MFIIDQEEEKVVDPVVEIEEEATETVVNEIVEEETETVEEEVPEAVVNEVVEEETETVEEEVPEAVVNEVVEEETETVEEEVPEAIVNEVEEIVEPEPMESTPVKPAKEEKKTPEDEMLALMDEHFARFKEGEIIEGVVVSIDERAVLVDIGFKSESPIQIKEFSAGELPEIGTRIKVFIDSVEDISGRIKLSKKKADFYINIEELNRLMESNETVTGILRRRVKGGMIAEVMSLEAFLPGSQISIKPIPNLDQFIGKESEFKILKINKERRNIIVSRKKVLEEKRQTQLSSLKEHLDIGSELDGEVRNITDYGAFIDLGGIDGLLHITDMSWGHINHPSDMLNIGDKVKVKVLEYDEESQKVSLGLKQLVPHPWDNIEKKYPEGSIVSGKVVNILPYGAFIELESGVEGLVHVSEMSWTKKIKHPKHVVKMGETIKAIVLAISKEDRRISLGIKQMEPNPWLMIEERYPIGSELSGHIKSLTPFGAFVEIEDNIEGLIHISDISWTKRIYHPREIFKKGQEINVKVLSIDSTLHRIALGVKQLTSDPWENLDEFLPINTEINATIVKIISKGVLVDVNIDDNVVEGFVPLSHLAIPGLRKASTVFKVGEEMPLKIIELDLENRRLILSVKAFFFARDKKELQDFIDAHKVENASPEDFDPHVDIDKMMEQQDDMVSHESYSVKEEEETPAPVEETDTEEEEIQEEDITETPLEEAEEVPLEELEEVVEVPLEEEMETPEETEAEEDIPEEEKE
ncbi:MAG: 30S ribosomal protein S1 [Candidatus Cloacimonetes bacterium]|nr:30S ribosomal protein S1 [Candidatus Cloacimonadota bacterium]